jgi:glycolate oxidase
MLDPTLLSALGDILPPSAIVATAEGTRAYECDGLTLFREQPLAVLLPENGPGNQHPSTLSCGAAARGARGAGTGLSGSATPYRKGVVLSLAKFKRILSIDHCPAAPSFSRGAQSGDLGGGRSPWAVLRRIRRRDRLHGSATSPRTPAACTV